MNLKLKFIFREVLLLALVFHSLGVTAQRIDNLSMKDGLFGDVLQKVYRDSDGYLWILGVNGVARHDGSQIKNFLTKSENKKQVIRELYTAIEQDKKGRIWIGGNTGLYYYDENNNTLESIEVEGRWRVSIIGNYDENHIWVSCFGRQNFLVNINTKTVEKQKESFTILSSTTDVSGVDWGVTTRGKILKNYRDTYFDYKKRINDLCFSPNGNLFIATDNGVLFLKRDDFKEKRINFKSITTLEGGQINFDKVFTTHYFKNNVWIGTRNGMSQIVLNEDDLPKSVRHHYNQPDDDFSLPSNFVIDISSDNEGILWIATYGGLGKIDSSKQWFYSFQKNPEEENSLYDNRVFSVNGDEKGNMWFGNSTSGLTHYNTVTKKFTGYDQTNSQLTSNNICSIYTDIVGQTWISVKNNLFSWEKQNIAPVQIIDKNNQPITYQNLYSIIQHPNKSYWMGIGNKVIKTDKISERVFKISKVLETQPFQALCFYIDAYKRIWAGGNNGVMMIDSGNEDLVYRYDITNQSAFKKNAFQTIQEDSKGNLWLGSTNGLYRKLNDSIFKSDPVKIQFEGFFEEEGLTNNYITGLLSGKDGQMWLSSWKGIMKYNPQNLPRYHFTSFNHTDGLVSEKFNRYGAFLDTQSCTYYFGSVNGVNYFKDEKQKVVYKTPSVLFKEVLVDGINVKIKPKLNTKGDSNIVCRIKRIGAIKKMGISFSSSSLLVPNHQVFEWKLEGRDKKYTSTYESQFVLNNIPPGKYYLKVRTSNNHMQFSPDSVIEIEIESVFTNGAKVIIPVFLIIGIIYFVRRKRKLKKRIPEQSNERYSNSNLTEIKQKELVSLLHKIMKEEQPYLRSDFKASELAKLMEISTVKLSQILNDALETKFYDFINLLRVNDFIRRLENNEDENLTLIGIAQLCGFSSKSTFYRAFDRFKGMTPSQFAKNIKGSKKQ